MATQSRKASAVDKCAHCEVETDDPGKRVRQPQKKALTNRLRRIEGQIGGVLNMIENDRYCVDILMQISAVKSALDGVAIQILSAHASGCVRKAVKEDGGDDAIEELLGVVRRMMR
ncbi:metal-sensitive transcriptional regulator [Gluconacetobacter sacchari]|uniref:Metal-sensitive transcriptional regulator n=2 Tax=Gluconacetobacter sacchari TaxID=92759 RepID=A0A7W4NTH7_9PROT|nr:metal-sensitive transcriptional regulator [Gluconacetobacter sacchari]MBB2162315.1 metal-sensitive transcriptional regulator [Gluconacetobacter sacchari]